MDVIDVVDMSDQELLRDPFTGYSRIREQTRLIRGVLPGLDPQWMVTRYDDVKMVLNDTRFVSNPANVPGMRLRNLSEQMALARGYPAEYLKYRLDNVAEFDGAAHVRLRTLVSRAFSVREVARMRPRIEDITERLLHRLAEAVNGGARDKRTVDLLSHFAYPLPNIVICELIGIPNEDRPQWQQWMRTLWSVTGPQVGTTMQDVVAGIRRLIERRRAEPADDLITRLIQAQGGVGLEEGDRLNDTEIISMILILNFAGYETTTHLIGNGTAALLAHPDQLALLRRDPSLTPGAVHEMLRWCGPTQVGHLRYATEDVEIGGMTVRKSEGVLPILVSANFDPRVFEAPERFDITREVGGRRETHVTFSYGPHYCLGAALARQEAEVAFEALLRHFPHLALAVEPADLEYEPVPRHWRLKALPLILDSTAN
jgi:hypothetical protein